MAKKIFTDEQVQAISQIAAAAAMAAVKEMMATQQVKGAKGDAQAQDWREIAQEATAAFKWTKKLDKAIKDKPDISADELRTAYPEAKGVTRKLLKARKVELGVR